MDAKFERLAVVFNGSEFEIIDANKNRISTVYPTDDKTYDRLRSVLFSFSPKLYCLLSDIVRGMLEWDGQTTVRLRENFDLAENVLAEIRLALNTVAGLPIAQDSFMTYLTKQYKEEKEIETIEIEPCEFSIEAGSGVQELDILELCEQGEQENGRAESDI
jgi:hypothetical protein